MVDDEINADDGIMISHVTWKKKSGLPTLKNFKFVSTYNVTFVVETSEENEICTLTGDISDQATGQCNHYTVKANIKKHDTESGQINFLTIEVYNKNLKVVSSEIKRLQPNP